MITSAAGMGYSEALIQDPLSPLRRLHEDSCSTDWVRVEAGRGVVV
jgi:hypothetical protein